MTNASFLKKTLFLLDFYCKSIADLISLREIY